MTYVTPQYLAEQGLSQTFPERFWAKVDKVSSPNGCWLWTASKTHGYGTINTGFRRTMSAPRAAWILCVGPIPKTKEVCHDCPNGDNPGCCNPAHLWLGSHTANVKDMFQKGRGKPCGGNWPSGERNPFAKLTQEQAKEIRSLYKPFLISANALARRFGVSKPTILRIIHGVHY